MKGDYIQIIKSESESDYQLTIYFSKIDSKINIQLNEINLIKLLDSAVSTVNSNSKTIQLKLPQKIESLLNEKGNEELENLSKKFKELKNKVEKPIADVIIYIADKNVSLVLGEKITNACGDFMEAMGFELETQEEPVFGSFLKRLRFVFSNTIGNEDLEQLYLKGKKYLELKYLELPTAEQTEKLATSAEKLVASLNDIEEGVIRCGALLVLKKIVNGKKVLIVQQLSTDLIITLDKFPKLINNPEAIYTLLTSDNKDGNDINKSEVILV